MKGSDLFFISKKVFRGGLCARPLRKFTFRGVVGRSEALAGPGQASAPQFLATFYALAEGYYVREGLKRSSFLTTYSNLPMTVCAAIRSFDADLLLRKVTTYCFCVIISPFSKGVDVCEFFFVTTMSIFHHSCRNM